MDLLTFLGIIATIVTIAVGIGAAVRSIIDDESDKAKSVLAITGSIVAVILIVGLIAFQARGASGGQQAGGTGSPRTSPTATDTPTDTSTPTITPIPKPTATAVPPGTVLYRETGSDNWSGWEGSGEWKVSNGILINDGSQGGSGADIMPTIVSSFQPSTANYSIEVQAQLPNGLSSILSWVGIAARIGAATGTTSGYAAYVRNGDVIGIDTSEKNLVEHCCFEPGTGWRTYRFELRGTTLNFYIDGALVLSSQDAQFLTTAGQIGFRDNWTLVYIRSCVVKAL